jgi:hypothetical protein
LPDPLENLRRAKQGAKKFQTETHISSEVESTTPSNEQKQDSTKPETRRLTVDMDAKDFYAFKKWCLLADTERKETVNMTVVINALVRGVLNGHIDPFEG